MSIAQKSQRASSREREKIGTLQKKQTRRRLMGRCRNFSFIKLTILTERSVNWVNEPSSASFFSSRFVFCEKYNRYIQASVKEFIDTNLKRCIDQRQTGFPWNGRKKLCFLITTLYHSRATECNETESFFTF